MSSSRGSGVLLIYTGGTIGSLHEDRGDLLSPLVPACFQSVMTLLPFYDPTDKKIPIGSTLVRLGAYSWEQPLDSSNIAAKDWQEMATVVRRQ